MKKRAAVCAVILGAAIAMTGCATEEISNEYVTISKYKGVEVPKVEGIPEITEESVDNNINTVLMGFSKTKEVTDRPAQKEDVVVLDYTAVDKDGQKIEEGSAKDYELEIGAGSFFKEFEDGIVGHNKGDEFKLEHTFPEDYTNEALAGKDVTLSITIKSINEKETPDLTDEFVQTISQESDTVEEYREEIKKLLEANNKEYIMTELTETAWAEVLKNSEVKEYPKEKLEQEKQTFYEHYKKGAETYEMEFEEFLKQMELTEETFEKQVTEAAKSNVKENVIVELIADKAKITLTDEDYEKEEEALAKEMGYGSVEEMEKEAPAEYIKSYILRDKVKEWVAENCIQVAE